MSYFNKTNKNSEQEKKVENNKGEYDMMNFDIPEVGPAPQKKLLARIRDYILGTPGARQYGLLSKMRRRFRRR